MKFARTCIHFRQGYFNVLKLARCPHSLIASLTTLPSMSRTPFAPFASGRRDKSPAVKLLAA